MKTYIDDPLVIQRLLEGCRRGDALAWESLVRRFQGRIYGFAFYYVGDREESRDLAQEIFVRIYQGLDGFQDDQAFVPWMLTMARNCCIDHLRRRKVRSNTAHPLPEDHPEAADLGPDPLASLEARARKNLLYRALDLVSDPSREMILLKDIQGLKLQEIADMLLIPLGTVKSRSGRARLELADVLRRMCPGDAS